MLEETGFDITDRVREEDFVAAMIGDQDTKLFIVQVCDEGSFVVACIGASCPELWTSHSISQLTGVP